MVIEFNFSGTISKATPSIPTTVLLPTVSVKVHAGRRSDTIRGIMAWASQFNLISDACRKRFNLPLLEGGMPSAHSVEGIATPILGKSRIEFSPHFDQTNPIILEVFVVEKINSTVSSVRLLPMVREHLTDFELADPNFDESGEIDLLLGVPFCPMLLKEGRYLIPGTSSCYAMESILGWIVMGRAPLEDYHVEQAPPQNYVLTG